VAASAKAERQRAKIYTIAEKYIENIQISLKKLAS
jgi:hypothetical protein